jgi:hypothetical protein
MRSLYVIIGLSLLCICFSFSNLSCVQCLRADTYQPPVTGTITAGPKADLIAGTVNPSGGVLTVTKPGDPLDGLKLEVPSGAYSDTRNFKISQAPVQSHTFGKDFNPISPLITVENGGGYSGDTMILKIPVKIPAGYFAMAFFYNEDSKMLDGIPLIAEDANSLTIATRHFSSLVVSMVAEDHLKTFADSGFRPGTDDWQFPNYGSYVAPGGHCTGQSITAMWYYCEKRPQGAKPLYGLYDNNGKGKTPLWEDDSLGYRFASVVWADIDFTKRTREYIDFLSTNPRLTRNMFAYTMKETRQPQYIGIYGPGGGHTMVVYKIDQNGTLYIADPNFPGKGDRVIQFQNNEYKPYYSAENANAIRSGQSHEFNRFIFMGKYTLIDKNQVVKRWNEFGNKTIGTVDNNKFPAYTLMAVNQAGQKYRLTDGLITGDTSLTVVVDSLPTWQLKLYKNTTATKPDIEWTNKDNPAPKIKLNPGKNLLGFSIWSTTPFEKDYLWVDFQWITVYQQALAINPPMLNGRTNQAYTFKAVMDNPPNWIEYEWFVNGEQKKSGSDSQISLTFDKENTYTVTVKLRDKNSGGYIGEASATANIKGETQSPIKRPEISISPLTVKGEPGKNYSFSAVAENPPAQYAYDWYIGDTLKAKDAGNSVTVSFSSEGSFWVTVKLRDKATDKYVCEAIAVAGITTSGPSQTPATPTPSKTPSKFTMTFQWDNGSHDDTSSSVMIMARLVGGSTQQYVSNSASVNGKGVRTLTFTIDMSGLPKGEYSLCPVGDVFWGGVTVTRAANDQCQRINWNP